MRVSEAWLRDHVNPAVPTDELVQQLTMAGLEVDSVEPVAAEFQDVVVGEVLTVEPHPDADRLRVCSVSTGQAEPLQIVCGAANVTAGLRVPTALIGAVLNNGALKIKRSKLRGVASFGMLCSATELGLAETSEGLMALPETAPIGEDIHEYLQLDDRILDIDLTPNRADCLSVEGIARETALLNQMTFQPPEYSAASITHDHRTPVTVHAADACPRYLGRRIQGVNNQAETPLWMQERLRRGGIRSLGPLVDITNYVLLELGQPLHAFDNTKLNGSIQVRPARTGETLALLNGQTVTLDNDVLVIADDTQAIALAGVMGGETTAVDARTHDVFLECAFFTPSAIAGKARRFGLHTDSSHRFERGVDPELQTRALERTTQLILDIAGGSAGPIESFRQDSTVTERPAITLRAARIRRILGIELTADEVETIFQRLGMQITADGDQWQVIPPSFRFDIAIEADLIEELGRIYGYDALPRNQLLMRQTLGHAPETVVTLDRVQDLLVDRGYQEAITYSFVDAATQARIAPNTPVIQLSNPLSADLSVMRTTLWGGLLQAAQYNQHRQQARIRLFEAGQCFIPTGTDNGLQQNQMIAGLVTGPAFDEQWGQNSQAIDFFDLKSDVESILALTAQADRFTFKAAQNPALHPGQSAQILTPEGQALGWIGMLHPSLEKNLDLNSRVFLFELEQTALLKRQLPAFQALSRFPSVRRDLAIVVDENIPVSDLLTCIYETQSTIVTGVKIFDVYSGERVELGKRSIAFGLILQASSQTLVDAEIEAVVSDVLKSLTKEFRAELRD